MIQEFFETLGGKNQEYLLQEVERKAMMLINDLEQFNHSLREKIEIQRERNEARSHETLAVYRELYERLRGFLSY
jgi:hypothetical protein